MTTVAEAINYQNAIHAQERRITELHRRIRDLERQLRDLRQTKLTELHDAGMLQEMLYPAGEGR